MSTLPSQAKLSDAISRSRGWLIAGGILSIIVGFLAIGLPYVFSTILVQLLGAFALVSGVISFFVALFGHHVPHRIVSALFAIIRIGAGLALLIFVPAGIAALTLILSIFFFLEGISCIAGSLKMRNHSGWIWLFLNGVAALVLGGMVYTKWPNDSAWVIGLLYGINSLFAGLSLLTLGLSTSRKA